MPSNSFPKKLKFFLNFFILFSDITVSRSASATIIFRFLKSPSSSIFRLKYFNPGLYAKALLAGIVHGVVVQIITSEDINFSFFDLITLKDV